MGLSVCLYAKKSRLEGPLIKINMQSRVVWCLFQISDEEWLA